MNWFRFFISVCFLLIAPSVLAASDEDTLYLDLKDGRVVIELFPSVAPRHVERVRTLANSGFYDNLTFHRVIDGFMAQTGDPDGTGAGGSDEPDLRAEFSDIPFERGILGMARSGHPDSANSQFFITFDDAFHLNGQYTVFGQVTEGMKYVDLIKRGDQSSNGSVTDPDKIVRMRTADKE